MPPVAPMLAKPVAGIPAGRYYEPKWDGFRSIVFRDGDEVEIGSRNTRPMARYFPDVVAAVKANLPRALRRRRGDRGRGHGRQARLLGAPAAPAPGGQPGGAAGRRDARELHRLRPARRWATPTGRRGRSASAAPALEDALAAARRRRCTSPRSPATRRWPPCGSTASRAPGVDGLIAKAADEPYRPDKRVMAKVKHVRTADCVLTGYRVHKSGPDALGSLLLGLYADDSAPAPQWGGGFGGLMPVGVVGAFPMARRRELLAELQPLVCPLEEHPWGAMAAAAGDRARPPRHEPLEPRQGALVRAAAARAGRRGPLRLPRGHALPPRRPVRPLAPGPRPAVLRLRPARAAASRSSWPTCSPGASSAEQAPRQLVADRQ